jgi:hypothetical protein
MSTAAWIVYGFAVVVMVTVLAGVFVFGRTLDDPTALDRPNLTVMHDRERDQDAIGRYPNADLPAAQPMDLEN